MQKTICSRCASKGIPRWLPVPVEEYRSILINANSNITDDVRYFALASNAAYEFQYLEFIDYELESLKLTESLRRQMVKTYIITASNIMEGILDYALSPSLNIKNVTYSQLINEAVRINLLGVDWNFYKLMKEVKQLRNKTHIQLSKDTSESDYNSFTESAHSKTKHVLRVFVKQFYRLNDEVIHEYFHHLDT